MADYRDLSIFMNPFQLVSCNMCVFDFLFSSFSPSLRLGPFICFVWTPKSCREFKKIEIDWSRFYLFTLDAKLSI